MAQELLSTDPKAGLLSSDPSAGVIAASTGSERTRQDTSAIGVDHERIKNSIANWASKLPPAWQRPAAMLATFPADVLASLVETISAPESVATMGAGGVPKPAAAVERSPSPSLGTRAAAVARPVLKATGKVLDNDIAGAISPRAAHLGKMATRVSEALEKRAATAAEPVSPAASSPATPTPPTAAAPAVAGPKLPAAPSLSLSPEEAQAVQELVKQGYPEADVLRELQAQRAASTPAPKGPPAAPAPKPKLAGAELKEYVRLINSGKRPEEALDLIVQQRALAKSLKLPTSDEVRRSVADRNVSGRWKDDQ